MIFAVLMVVLTVFASTVGTSFTGLTVIVTSATFDGWLMTTLELRLQTPSSAW
jgi:hypothetical protein